MRTISPGDYAAIIFDLDGVLLDSEPIHYQMARQVLADDGLDLEEATYRTYTGMSLEATWRDLVVRLRLPRPAEHYQSRYLDAVTRALEHPIDPAPGATALIEWLRRRGIPIGLASSSKQVWVEASLRAIGLEGVFDAVVSADQVAGAKPDPELYVLAAHRLGVSPGRCLAIEDSLPGVRSARAAGMDVVAVRTPLNQTYPFDEATAVVPSLAALLPI